MDRYQKSFEEALELNSQNEEKWQKYKTELAETKINLKEFVKSRTVNIMVPVGKKAFVRGTLHHTNELTVSHGASIFSDVSTTQAINILDNRLVVCDNRLVDLEKERNLFTNKVKLPGDLFGTYEEREIIEEFHEEEEKAWRRKHAESIRNQKQKESEERLKKKPLKDVNINQLLDDYEMLEELVDELETFEINDSDTLLKIMNGEMKPPESKTRVAHSFHEVTEAKIVKESMTSEKSPESVPEISNDLIQQNNQEIVELLKTYRCKIKDVLKNVKKDDERNVNLFLDLIELKDDIEDDIRKMNDDEEYSGSDSDERDSDDEAYSIDSKPEETKRKVRFSTSLEDVKLIESKSELYDNLARSENSTIEIHFQHSNAKFTNQQLSAGVDTVAHPGEVCKRFEKPLTTISATKSILKTRGKEANSQRVEEKPITKLFHSDIRVIGDVVEHNKEANQSEEVVHIMIKDDAPKKVSKFKQMRLMS